MEEYMSYEEYLVKVKEGIVTERGNCPVTPLLQKLQGKWKTQILYELCMHDHVRYGEFRKALPEITGSMLSTALKELEADGLVVRKMYDEMPVRVEYNLTGRAKSLIPILLELKKWGEDNL